MDHSDSGLDGVDEKMIKMALIILVALSVLTAFSACKVAGDYDRQVEEEDGEKEIKM